MHLPRRKIPPRPHKRITRSLRFRVTIGYALFFTLLLMAVSFVLRQDLKASLDLQLRGALDQDWAAVKGYLRIENGSVNWFYDRDDPEEASIVAKLWSVYLLTDPEGKPLRWSDTYRNLGFDTPAEIQETLRAGHSIWREKRDARGIPYLIRTAPLTDEKRTRTYFFAIGRSEAANRRLLQGFTWRSIALIPVMIFGGSVLGWIFAGRALSPVLEIAKAAQRIGGSNLSLRVPTREAGDELDYLIETFNQMIERLENSFNQIRQFSTDVSHELRTPITVIRGELEVALFTAKSSEQYREAIINSLQDIERLSQIVRALLLLSQAETGQVVLQKAPLDMCEVVKDIVDQFQIPADGAQIRLSLQCSAQDCHIEADRVQIERMLSNLLSNALKFTPAGGEIRVTLLAEAEEMALTIEDTGCGIPAESLPHIFDRFYRVRSHGPATPEKGLGLGLSFVAWIVKAHDGTVDVDSTPGRGTKFTVHLPLRTAPVPLPEPERVVVNEV